MLTSHGPPSTTASEPTRVRIFDTTLRDGEQSPGASMTSQEKLEVARALAQLGVDVIEAGFAASSPDDFEAIRQIALDLGQRSAGAPPIVCSLARAHRNDIQRAWEAVQAAARPRIHTFIGTSPQHMTHKLRMRPDEVVERVRDAVGYARSLCADVEFSPEDAGRSDPEFLYQVLEEAIRAGATTLNIPDTVGYTIPEEYGRLISGILRHTPRIDRCIVSVHCHNDLGLATANTLAALHAGARQAEVTINGIGERAGNTSLEEVVMALHTRRPYFNLHTGIDTTQIMRTSRLVSQITGIPVQPNKAIVGANAFAHESGIHQDGYLKHPSTYEIMRPEAVGLTASRLLLGKLSGRHALRVRLHELGHEPKETELDVVFERFKTLADRKKVITDADLEALMSHEARRTETGYALESLQVTCGTLGLPTASLRLRDAAGHVHSQASMGYGPVHAVFNAIDQIVKTTSVLREYAVHSVTEGMDALGEVTVRVQPETSEGHGKIQVGRGVDTDIIIASAKAYLAALNRVAATHPTNAPASPPPAPRAVVDAR